MARGLSLSKVSSGFSRARLYPPDIDGHIDQSSNSRYQRNEIMVLDNLTKAGKVGLGLFILGTCFFLVGFSVPYWMTFDSLRIHVGLWEYCSGDSCGKTTSSNFRSFDNQDGPNWYMGTQALACLALIALIIDFVFRILFICGKPKRFLLISVVLDCITATLAFLAAVVFGSKVEQYSNISLNWGFAFDIIGGIFFVGSAVCFLVEYIRRR